jgi:hypothetical protein
MGGMSTERPTVRPVLRLPAALGGAWERAPCAATLPLVALLWRHFDSYHPRMGPAKFLRFHEPAAFLLWLVWVTAAARVARDLWPSPGRQCWFRRGLAVSACCTAAARWPLRARWASGDPLLAGAAALALVPAGHLVWAWASWRVPA